MKEPLKDVLVDPVDEQMVVQVWQRIQAPPTRARRSWVPATVATAALLALLALHPERRRLELTPPPGPFGVLPGLTRLSDDSSIALLSGHLALVENNGQLMSFALDYGRVRFEVRPGGPRRWRVHCREVVVEVVGTRFVVDQTEERLQVEVEEGRVRLIGPSFGGRAISVGPGEVLELPRNRPVSAPPPSSPPTPVGPSSSVERRAPRVVGASVGEVATATMATSPTSPPAERELWVSIPPGLPRPDQLLRSAEEAERAREYSAAVQSLSRMLDEAPDHPRASWAAFTMGRLELRSLNRPRDAVRSFLRATALGQLTPELAEECAADLAEAHLKAYDVKAAQAAAREYLDRYPRGARRSSMQLIESI